MKVSGEVAGAAPQRRAASSSDATYPSTMRALMENVIQCQMRVEDLSLVPRAAADVPARAHFRRTAITNVELEVARIEAFDHVAPRYPS